MTVWLVRRRSGMRLETDGVVAAVTRVPESHSRWWMTSAWLQMGSNILFVATGDSAQVNSASRTSTVSIYECWRRMVAVSGATENCGACGVWRPTS